MALKPIAEVAPLMVARKPVLPISVIVPAYNAARWLERCLSSVEQSTHLPAEVIVIDDGSTDDTVRIAREHGAIVLQQANAGPAAARNRGIKAATQEWIALLDADDEWHPRKLELQHDLIVAEPDLDFVFTDWDQVDASRSSTTPDALGTYWNYNLIAKHQVIPHGFVFDQDSFADLMPRWHFLAVSSILFKKRHALEIGAFPEDMRYAEDLIFFLRYLRNGTPGVVELPLVKFLRHANQATSQEVKVRASFVALADEVASNPSCYHPRSVRAIAGCRQLYLAELAVAQAKNPKEALQAAIGLFRDSPSALAAIGALARTLLSRSWLNRLRRRLKPAARRGADPTSGRFETPWRPSSDDAPG